MDSQVFRDIPVTIDGTKSLSFQVIDWYSVDLDDDNDEERTFLIKMFGVTEHGNSVSMNVYGFQPFFYITCTNKTCLSSYHIQCLKNNILTLFEKQTASGYLDDNLYSKIVNSFDIIPVKKKSMWGFTNNETKQYLKFEFDNVTTMYKVKNILWKKMRVGDFVTSFKFHESNLDPMIRFVHQQNLQPGGWVTVSNYSQTNDELESKCQINVSTHWKQVHPFENNSMAPFVVLSFDIECTSSHGDFPMAQKSYSKSANELSEYYKIVQKTMNERTLLINAITSMFTSEPHDHISKVFTKKSVDINTIQTCILEHIDDIISILENKIHHLLGENEKPTKRSLLRLLNEKLSKILPEVEGDPIIQIGTTVHRYGETKCFYKNVITLGTCKSIDGVDVIQCETEADVIKEWCSLVNRIDPDIMTGYNILGFDFDYMYKRSQELGCVNFLRQCSRMENHLSEYREKNLSSSALGDNLLKYVDMEGRVIVDLMKIVQRDHKLDSYKLDHVVNTFINGKITRIDGNILHVENTTGLNKGDFIHIRNEKYQILDVHQDDKTIELYSSINETKEPNNWGLAKDDVTPQEIFQCQKGTAEDRARIAKYCVQDCALCNSLMIKLEVLANNIGMANVCLVPLSYIFLRGQGIKIFSLVAKQCADDGFVVPYIKFDPDKLDDEDGYEGAIVLDPIPGIYVDAPVSVMDYASLYPSSMISENISHDSIVLDNKYDNLEGYEYVNITYDIFDENKNKIGEKVCRYAQFPNGEKGLLPRILMKLLSQRKLTRKKCEFKRVTLHSGEFYEGTIKEHQNKLEIINVDQKSITILNDEIHSIRDAYNEFTKVVLDGLQLAYKVTANSLYGQVGARTSPIYMKELAASTTSTGRSLILKAKAFMEKHYDGKVIYGDTDSIFVDFRIKEKYNLDGKEALQKSIDVSVEASNAFKRELKRPHDLEYEKTFFPFIILSKKKYVGNLYEMDVNKFKQKSMGIVLKRRDNANIVKKIYGGIIDILLNQQTVHEAVQFLQKSVENLSLGKYDMSDLVITKTLKKDYIDPTKIAHKVLADRMRLRDPGSAPQVNDRIPYVYIEHDISNKELLQGDKIEHPKYIMENKLKIDFIFYITNQIMKPVCQLLALALFDLPKSKTRTYYSNKLKSLIRLCEGDVKKAEDKINVLKQKEVEELLFSPILRKLKNKRSGATEITSYFKLL